MGHFDAEVSVEGPPPVGADLYRGVMQNWPSGVTVITMLSPEGPHGMTASAFTSVSISPPLVLIVVDKRWRSHAFIAASGEYCVNILAEGQEHLSDRFAGRVDMADRFEGLDVSSAVTGAPVLREAIAFLDCVVQGSHDAGDHTVFIGRVAAAGVLRPDARPLVYYDRAYAHLSLGPH